MVRSDNPTKQAPLDATVFACTLLAMRSTDLTEAQARALAERLLQLLAYLGRLTKRMEQERFPADDQLYQSAREAYNAMHDLTVKAHYLRCKGQTGGKR